MEEKLKKIIDYYGINNQQRKLQEEVFELQEAITELDMAERDVNLFDIEHFKGNIVEELADVFVILNQLAIYYKIDEDKLYNIMEYKINRTLNRMED
jgi:NTP pyrophosphatase (non-canonical NTP hydrolase)